MNGFRIGMVSEVQARVAVWKRVRKRIWSKMLKDDTSAKASVRSQVDAHRANLETIQQMDGEEKSTICR